MVPENFKESSDPIADFTSSLIEISKECISPTKSNPWYNDDCKEPIKQHNKLYLNSKDLQIPTISMTSKYLELKSLERLKFRIASHGDLMFRKTNKKNLINKVRDMIRKISGKTKSSIYTHLNRGGTEIYNKDFNLDELVGAFQLSLMRSTIKCLNISQITLLEPF